MKISIMSNWFHLGFEGGIRRAKELGVTGSQIHGCDLGFDLESTPVQSAVDGIKAFMKEEGMEFSAFCVEVGGFASDDAQVVAANVKKSKALIKLAAQAEVSVVTGHIGKVPEDKTDPKYIQIKAALEEIGACCAECGVMYGIETGPEKAYVLRALLEDLDHPNIGVNFDPANLVMCSDDDPVEAVRILGPYIKHCHAKDGICLTRPVHKAWPNVPEGAPWIEVPLGQGEVDFPRWIQALREVDFEGYMAIERECDNADQDIRAAVDYLKALV